MTPTLNGFDMLQMGAWRRAARGPTASMPTTPNMLQVERVERGRVSEGRTKRDVCQDGACPVFLASPLVQSWPGRTLAGESKAPFSELEQEVEGVEAEVVGEPPGRRFQTQPAR